MSCDWRTAMSNHANGDVESCKKHVKIMPNAMVGGDAHQYTSRRGAPLKLQLSLQLANRLRKK